MEVPEPEKDSVRSAEQMLILEKYETVIAYLYPIAQSVARRHGEHKRLDRFIASWRGHAAHADTCNLFNSLEERYGIAFH